MNEVSLLAFTERGMCSVRCGDRECRLCFLECHFQGAPGGGGPIENNVTVYGIATPDTKGLPRVGVVHRRSVQPEHQEYLSQVNLALPRTPSMDLRELIDRRRSGSLPAGVVVTQRNTPALFGDGLIDVINEDMLVKNMREHSSAATLSMGGLLDSFFLDAPFNALNGGSPTTVIPALGFSVVGNPDRPVTVTVSGMRQFEDGIR